MNKRNEVFVCTNNGTPGGAYTTVKDACKELELGYDHIAKLFALGAVAYSRKGKVITMHVLRSSARGGKRRSSFS